LQGERVLAVACDTVKASPHPLPSEGLHGGWEVLKRFGGVQVPFYNPLSKCRAAILHALSSDSFAFCPYRIRLELRRGVSTVASHSRAQIEAVRIGFEAR